MDKKSYLIGFAAVILIFAVCIGPAAAAYANYEYVWTASGNQFIMESYMDGIAPGTTPTHYINSYGFALNNLEEINLASPFVNSGNKNGVHPKVRYLWFALRMPVGVNTNTIIVYNGPTQVYNKGVYWTGTGAYKEYMLDMGSYKDINRGINTALYIENTLDSQETVYTYGVGAKEEW